MKTFLRLSLVTLLFGIGTFAVVGSTFTADVKCGIDNLIDTDFALLKGKRVVLVTHAAARARSGRSTAEEFMLRKDIRLVRILAPEHGYYGVVGAGETVHSDTLGGTPVVSLYGALRRPDSSMLSDADVVVIDMQDIGVRSYTYISTMTEVMEACALFSRPLIVLDRPNPLGGTVVDGNLPDPALRSFIGRLPIPYVHGCTMGELATMTNEEGWLAKGAGGQPRRCSLTVVRLKRWKRSMSWEETGLPWYPTSPNIPTVHAVRGYAVTGLTGELGPVSIGIGTASPFTVIGAPTLAFDTILVRRLARYGVIAQAARYNPAVGKFARQVCTGYYLAFSMNDDVKPFRAALALLSVLHRSQPALFPDSLASSRQAGMFNKAVGSSAILPLILSDGSWTDIEALAVAGLQDFLKRREKYLLY